jgi:hypothetical protein
MLTVGKSVDAFEGQYVGLDIVCDGAAGVGLKVGYSVTGAAAVASDAVEAGETVRFSVVGGSLGKEADEVGPGDFEGELGNADGSRAGFKSDGFELTDGSALGCRLGDVNATLLGRVHSVVSMLPVAVGPGESVGLALCVTVRPGEPVGS